MPDIDHNATGGLSQKNLADRSAIARFARLAILVRRRISAITLL